ncbi:hypothetical protein VNO78_34253 [Psophocarpus tetragonolobus]|uniref:Uncharacterized protein n=1 Tax=Psophocarpus tetragonolobus TaxID=3891 RepID=A0AAN9RS20_PSOTE
MRITTFSFKTLRINDGAMCCLGICVLINILGSTTIIAWSHPFKGISVIQAKSSHRCCITRLYAAYSFIISFAKSLALREHILPFCMGEVWVTAACLALVETTTSNYNNGQVAPDIEKEFFRLLGPIFSSWS